MDVKNLEVPSLKRGSQKTAYFGVFYDDIATSSRIYSGENEPLTNRKQKKYTTKGLYVSLSKFDEFWLTEC